MNFYSDPECTQILQVLKFDDSYVEDIYNGVLNNVVEIGTTVTKKIYAKNTNADMVVIKRIDIESPFITAVPEKSRLSINEVTPITVIFKPTLEGINVVEDIENPEEKQAAKERLLKGNIKIILYRVMMP